MFQTLLIAFREGLEALLVVAIAGFFFGREASQGALVAQLSGLMEADAVAIVGGSGEELVAFRVVPGARDLPRRLLDPPGAE